MSESDFAQLDNGVWYSLAGEHRHLGIHSGGANRYFSEVSPFAGLRANTTACLRSLAEIVSVGESILIRGEVPDLGAEWRLEKQISSVQNVLPAHATFEPNPALIRLSVEHAASMLELTRLVLPGFFQPRSPEMGAYYGIFDGSRLVAMTGERIFPKPFKEITAVCTHPDYQGRGYAAQLVRHVSALMQLEGYVPFLHVGAENTRARALYRRLGFCERTETAIFRIRRCR